MWDSHILSTDSRLYRRNDIASPVEHAASRQTDDRSTLHSLTIQLRGKSLAVHINGRNERKKRNTKQY